MFVEAAYLIEREVKMFYKRSPVKELLGRRK